MKLSEHDVRPVTIRFIYTIVKRTNARQQPMINEWADPSQAN